jgi:DNA invertase Pin-like site-specific DNA recombinase
MVNQPIFCCQNYISWYHCSMSYNVAIYARQSHDCTASAEDQIEHLKGVAAAHGWTIRSVFTDRPATVKKERRPGEVALIDAIRGGSVDKVLLWSIDRVGRSLVDLVGFMERCRASGVGLYLHEQGVDTSTSNGTALLDVAGMLAFHLRQMRRDRILRGQAAVKGIVRFGRPPISAARVEKAKQELSSGKGVRQVARLAGISPASVSHMKNSLVSPAEAM